MTREEILNMPAGEDLNKLVAEKVMGLNVHIKPERQVVDLGFYRRKKEYRIINWVYAGGNLLKSYSTDISAAWEVVEKMQTFYGKVWDTFDETLGEKQPITMMTSQEASLAICHAALIAMYL